MKSVHWLESARRAGSSAAPRAGKDGMGQPVAVRRRDRKGQRQSRTTSCIELNMYLQPILFDCRRNTYLNSTQNSRFGYADEVNVSWSCRCMFKFRVMTSRM